MKKKQTKKSKKQCPVGNFFKKIAMVPFLRMVLFVVAVGAVFFLIGNAIWQTKQFVDSGIEAEQNEHNSKIKSKLSEMEVEVDFFEKFLGELEDGKNMNIEESREANSRARNLSGQIADLERYYLDQRFDNSLNFFNRHKEKSEDFETIKRLARDGEFFLDNIIYLNLSSGANSNALGLTQYNFKFFREKYQEATKIFN